MRPGERQQAAELLRKARRESGESATEAAAWARCMAPESRAALRLEIDLAIRAGDQHHADATIAQGLLLWPDHAGLLLQFARRRMTRGLAAHARRAIERAVKQRPHHAATRLLAGAIAEKCSQFDLARAHFEAAAVRRPHRDEALTALFHLHLRDGDVDEAARVLHRFEAAPVVLRAQLLRAQKAVPDAISLLESQLDAIGQRSECDEILRELINLCDCAFDDDRVMEHMARTNAETPRAAVCGAAAMLRTGRFEEAGRRAEEFLDNPLVEQEAAAIVSIAALAQGDAEKATAGIDQLRALGRVDTVLLAHLWRQSLLGRLLNEIRHGSTPETESPLAVLIRCAHRVFASAGTDDEVATRHRALCEAAINGRSG